MCLCYKDHLYFSIFDTASLPLKLLLDFSPRVYSSVMIHHRLQDYLQSKKAKIKIV